MKEQPRHTISIQYYDSPCGRIVLASVGEMLCLCDWDEMPCAVKNKRRLVRMQNATFCEQPSEVLRRTREQLDEYFMGIRTAFDIPLHPIGTHFQKRVWEVLLDIPFGQTRTYKDIALLLGNAKGVRAVAGAIGANGISILIPCHRVIGSDHSLTGFAGGLEAKRILLALESKRTSADMLHPQAQQNPPKHQR